MESQASGPLVVRGGERGSERKLGRHLAHKVPFADLDAETAKNIVGSRRVEIKIRHRQVIEIVLGAEFALLAALGESDLRIFSAVELIGPQALEEIDGLVYARLHLGVAVVDGRKGGHLDTGSAASAKGVLACLTHLTRKGEHVGIEPFIQYRVFVPFVPGSVRL